MNIENAIIENVYFGKQHGMLTLMIQLQLGDCSVQSFGGRCLYNKNFNNDITGSYVMQILDTFEVEELKNIKGLAVRIKTKEKYGIIEEIGHIVKDKWVKA